MQVSSYVHNAEMACVAVPLLKYELTLYSDGMHFVSCFDGYMLLDTLCVCRLSTRGVSIILANR